MTTHIVNLTISRRVPGSDPPEYTQHTEYLSRYEEIPRNGNTPRTLVFRKSHKRADAIRVTAKRARQLAGICKVWNYAADAESEKA